MKSAVIVFPGSNCDRDVQVALTKVSGHAPAMVWHKEAALPKVDLVVLPGGFSYGDYLRCGAMASQSPVIKAVKEFADNGGFVLGICNGFQVLAETGMLPGVLMPNRDGKFICRSVPLKVESNDNIFASRYQKGQRIALPIAHHDGNYYTDEETLKSIEDNDQVVFRYVDASGKATEQGNPNGAQSGIAGITNKQKNVLGMMPHPERLFEKELGAEDGRPLFESLVEAFA